MLRQYGLDIKRVVRHSGLLSAGGETAAAVGPGSGWLSDLWYVSADPNSRTKPIKPLGRRRAEGHLESSRAFLSAPQHWLS